jgi:hypothetical protein
MENERLLTAHELLVIGMKTAMGDLIELQNETAKAQDAKSIAARDKRWIEQIDLYEAAINGTHCILMPLTTWQSLKQSLIGDNK